MMKPLFALLAAAIFSLVPATLKFDAPSGWTVKPPASSMRVAEFVLPKAQGDAEDATLVVTFFGGQGGTVEANLERWYGQMAQPNGKASKDVAKTTKLTAHTLPITMVDITGTYVAETSPGAAEHYNKPGFRLRAAVVEAPGGNYYVKLIGPEKTIARWDEAFIAFMKSLRLE